MFIDVHTHICKPQTACTSQTQQIHTPTITHTTHHTYDPPHTHTHIQTLFDLCYETYFSSKCTLRTIIDKHLYTCTLVCLFVCFFNPNTCTYHHHSRNYDYLHMIDISMMTINEESLQHVEAIISFSNPFISLLVFLLCPLLFYHSSSSIFTA